MSPTSVILVFDIGKTNKKALLFDETYRVVHERAIQLPEIKDEDGDACEDLQLLTDWVLDNFRELDALPEFSIKAVNFSAYGASFVYLDDYYKPAAPLYNYLKPYPEALLKQFYDAYGDAVTISKETASPKLGSLNSGMQLYRIKYEKPALYAQIKYALHLPQYLSYLITGAVYADLTSIGCHTQLWDFNKNNYHRWVYEEGIDLKLPPVFNGNEIVETPDGQYNIPVGVGLHDSSAALIPYLANFHEPFILLSTGTWCISLNPFNQAPLTAAELGMDCLCYIQFEGKPVKASRLFAGSEHEQQTKRLAEWFQVAGDHYHQVRFDSELMANLRSGEVVGAGQDLIMLQQSAFGERDLNTFANYDEAYHQLISDLIRLQVRSTGLVLQGSPVKRIFVDGGFGKNPVYMHLLAEAFPEIEVFAASIPQATSMGAAIAIHKHWNKKALPADIIDLKYYHLPSLSL